jgi:hypothetical protein
VWGMREKKNSKRKNQTWAEEMKKKQKKVNLSSPPWLAQGQGETIYKSYIQKYIHSVPH